MTRSLQVILEDWSQPVAVGLKLEANSHVLELSEGRPVPTANTGWSVVDLGDLILGRSIWVVGRVVVVSHTDLAFRLVGSTLIPQNMNVNRFNYTSTNGMKMIDAKDI